MVPVRQLTPCFEIAGMGKHEGTLATETLTQDPFAGYAPDEEAPLRSYALLMSVFATLASAFAVWFRSSGRELPDGISGKDLALLTVASHKTSRLIAKDRVTSPIRAPFTRLEGEGGPAEVSESARGTGIRKAIGELLICPYCLGMWTSAGYTGGLLVLPRFTRWVAAVMTSFFGSEVLQIAYKKAEETL
jgi:hypothetical protein